MPGWAPCFSGFCVGVNEEIPELDEFGDGGGLQAHQEFWCPGPKEA